MEFLSLVDTSKIPFSFIAGPAQDVHTNDEETLAWFAEQLSPPSPSDGPVHTVNAALKLRTGVLARVLDDSTRIKTVVPTWTEILFFASPFRATGLPSRDLVEEEKQTFTLKALPLNSAIPSYLPSPPLSPQPSSIPTSGTEHVIEAEFLPPLEKLHATAVANQRKRKQVQDVFDEATERRRRAKRHGGESMAAVAAAAGGVNVLVGRKGAKTGPAPRVRNDETLMSRCAPVSVPPPKRPHSRTTSVSGIPSEAIRRPLSRSPSMSSDHNPIISGRPPSRKSTGSAIAIPDPLPTKRSNLSRVSSLTESATTEERNKDAISRLVMAGMRLHGLSQSHRRKTASAQGHIRRSSQLLSNSPVLSPVPVLMSISTSAVDRDAEDEVREKERERDEEYKFIYHQTYKGVVFAFRRCIGVRQLWMGEEVVGVQDVVDKLLGIYCADPLGAGGGG